MPPKQEIISKETKAEETNKKAKPAKNSSKPAVNSATPAVKASAVAKPSAVASTAVASKKVAAKTVDAKKSAPAAKPEEVKASPASVVKPAAAPAKPVKVPVKKVATSTVAKTVSQGDDEFSPDKFYSPKHLWVKPNPKKNTAYVGITDYLAEELVAIDNVDLPIVGDEVEMDSFCAHLYNHNRIHHVRSPLSGRILEVNQEVQDSPSLLHLAPEKNWLFLMEYDDPDELDQLFSGQRYARFLDQRC